jgi:hypothetical protein
MPAPAIADMQRNVSVNSGDGPHLIRSVLTADIGVLLPGLNPGALDSDAFLAALAADPSCGKVFYTKRHSNIRLRFYAGGLLSSGFNKTAGITIIAQPHPSSDPMPGGDSAAPVSAKGKCRVIYKGILTFKGSRTPLLCPVLGNVDTLNWYECSDIPSATGVSFFDDAAIKLHPVGTMAAAATPEVQTIAINTADTTDTYTLQYGLAKTSAIAWNASPATGGASVQALLEAIPAIGVGGVVVTGSAGVSYTVTFSGALGVQGDCTTLVGGDYVGGMTVTIATPTPGVEGFQRYIVLDADCDQKLYVQVDSLGASAFRCGAECVS